MTTTEELSVISLTGFPCGHERGGYPYCKPCAHERATRVRRSKNAPTEERRAADQSAAEVSAAYWSAHPELARAQWDFYRTSHPEQNRAYSATRRARKLGNSIGFPKPDFKAILAEFGMVCHICGQKIESLDDLHFDHVISLAKEGPHSAENLRPSHALCNMRKGSKSLEDYLAQNRVA